MKYSYLQKAKDLLDIESRVIKDLQGRIDDKFHQVVKIIFHTAGKVAVIGMGKSGLIGKKISATLSSTGTPSFFIHAAEAAHGDLGGIGELDVVVFVSNSGETDELVKLIPGIKKIHVPIIGLIGNPKSTLAEKCDITIDTNVKKEACPLGIVPTASSISTLAMGDALAIALLDKRGFEETDFANLHPGGSLGRRLLTTVSDLMHIEDEVPMEQNSKTMQEVLFTMTKKALGVVGILDKNDELIGVVTDGDLRRGLEKSPDFLKLRPNEIMSMDPKWIDSCSLAIDALHKMEEYSITTLFVYQGKKEGKPAGIIHIHDILRYGIMS